MTDLFTRVGKSIELLMNDVWGWIKEVESAIDEYNLGVMELRRLLRRLAEEAPELFVCDESLRIRLFSRRWYLELVLESCGDLQTVLYLREVPTLRSVAWVAEDLASFVEDCCTYAPQLRRCPVGEVLASVAEELRGSLSPWLGVSASTARSLVNYSNDAGGSGLMDSVDGVTAIATPVSALVIGWRKRPLAGLEAARLLWLRTQLFKIHALRVLETGRRIIAKLRTRLELLARAHGVEPDA